LTNFVSAIVHAIGHGEVHHFFKSLCLKKIKEKLSAMSDLSWHMKGGATHGAATKLYLIGWNLYYLNRLLTQILFLQVHMTPLFSPSGKLHPVTKSTMKRQSSSVTEEFAGVSSY
jgi:hypothetical protein